MFGQIQGSREPPQEIQFLGLFYDWHDQPPIECDRDAQINALMVMDRAPLL